VRIAFFVRPTVGEGRVAPQVSATTAQTIELLRQRGARVDVVVPEAELWDLGRLRPEHDLYVLKSKTPLSLSLAAALEAAGARTVNRVAASGLAKDKLLHSALLARAGVPVPRAWACACGPALGRLLGGLNGARLLAKPPGGSMARGIRRLAAASELAGEDGPALIAAMAGRGGPPRPLLLQEEVPSDGLDLKLYVVGDWVAAIRRPFPARTEAEKRGRPAEVPSAIRRAALACGGALGLDLYGVDVLTSEAGFRVVDVNAFPSYRGIADGPRRVADFLLAGSG
jgi:ribosomal protein S6--L-glutamate ligase